MDNFKLERNGYDKKEVDEFVEKVKRNYEDTLQEQMQRISELKKQLDETAKKLGSYEKKNGDISDALVVAVETAKQIENASKNIYDLEIKRVRALYDKWEKFLEELMEEYPRLKERFDTKALLKIFSDGIDEVIKQNSINAESSTQGIGLRRLISKMNKINNKSDEELNNESIKNSVIKPKTYTYSLYDNLTSIGTVAKQQEEFERDYELFVEEQEELERQRLLKQEEEKKLAEQKRQEELLLIKRQQELQAKLEEERRLKEQVERERQEELLRQKKLEEQRLLEIKRQEKLQKEEVEKKKKEQEKLERELKEQEKKEKLAQIEKEKELNREKFDKSYFEDAPQLIDEDIFLKMEQEVETNEEPVHIIKRKDSNIIKDEENKKSQIKSISKIKINDGDKFENLVDKFLSTDEEDDKANSYEKAVLNKKKKENSFDLSEALMPDDDLSTIMESFDAFNTELEKNKDNKNN